MNGQHKRPTTTTAGDDEDEPYFIPSRTWKGPRSGYYFGTSDPSIGTGYYQDASVQSQSKRRKINEPTAEELLEQAEQNAAHTRVVTLTPAGIQLAASALHRAMTNNTMRRASAGATPHQYMDSEIALYEHVTALKAVAADPVQLYPVVRKETTLVADLLQLLLHDNVDMVSAVTSVWLEWMDTDVEEAHLQAVAELARAFLTEGADVLVENLGRMNEKVDDDEVGKGSDDILTLFQNFLDLDERSDNELLENSSVGVKLATDTTLVGWLLKQIAESSSRIGRSMELLSSIVAVEDVHKAMGDWSKAPRYTSSFIDEVQTGTVDGIEALLQVIATFKKRQPTDPDQVELLENSAVVMGSILAYSPVSITSFIDAQGIELVLRCLKERVYVGALALQWLDFDNGGQAVSKSACEHLVDAGAFKYLFPLFMGRNLPKHHDAELTKKDKKSFQSGIQSAVVRIIYGMIRHLEPNDPQERRARLLAKFTEEKIPRLVELLIDYDKKSRIAEYNFFKTDIEDDLDESMIPLAVLEAKLDAGGDGLHRLAAIAAFCCAGSKTIHSQILAELHKKESGMILIQTALEEFISVLHDGSQAKAQLENFLKEI